MNRARSVQAVVAVSLLAAVVSGRATLFVRPWFIPFVAATGLVLLLATRRPAEGEVTLAVAGLLLLPVVAGAAMTPDVAGAAPAWGPSQDTSITSRIGDDDNPLLRGEGGEVTVLQVVLADRELGAGVLDGRQVTVEAIVSAEGLTRQVMVCCAADARPVSVPTAGDLPAAGTWVRATGTLRADGDRLVLEVEDATEIDTPSRPLL